MMISLLSGTLSILATWTVLSVAFIGLGLGVKRMLGPSHTDVDQSVTCFWVGFSLAILFLQMWHFAFRISWFPLAIILVFGALGISWNRAALSAAMSRSGVRQHRALLMVLLGCGLWVANSATGSGDDWDYGVYHLSAVRWTSAYPIIHGLGNLHGRLAFNSSYYLYAAMLDVGPWSGASNHLANGLLVTALLFQIVIAAFRFWNDGQRKERRYPLELGLLAPALFLAARHGTLASVITDLPVAVLLFVAAAKLYNLVAGPRRDAVDESFDFFALMTLLTLATCMKLTAAGFALPAALLAGAVWVVRHRTNRSLVIRTMGTVCGIAVLLGGSWLARGVILSGYPLYPSSALTVPVEWRVPADQPRAELAWTRHYSRWYYNPPMLSRGWSMRPDGQWFYDPHPLDLEWHWLPGWGSNLWRNPEHREGLVLPVLLTMLAVLTSLARYGARSIIGANSRGWLLLLPTITALACWFLAAPAPRFGFFLLWILAATAIGEAVRSHLETAQRPSVALPLMVILLIGLLPLTARVVASSITTDGISLGRGLQQLVVLPPPTQSLLPSPPAEVKSFTTRSGLNLYTPAHGQRCWDAPLPCTPQPAMNLSLRRKEDLRYGFLNTDGQWLPQDFPDPRTYRSRERGVGNTP
jgi:hypothetical protein